MRTLVVVSLAAVAKPLDTERGNLVSGFATPIRSAERLIFRPQMYPRSCTERTC